MTNTKRYRMIGTTDDVVDCEQCGKPDLRMTVVLEMLDADGNGEGVTYFGSTCAARALAARGVRITAAKVRDEARFAQQRRERDAAYAQQCLDTYGIPADRDLTGAEWSAAVGLFLARNPITSLRPSTLRDAAEGLTRCIEFWRKAVAA